MPEHAPEDDALVRLASKLVRVKAHRRTTKTGNTEQVKSYIRKDLAARSDIGGGKTKSGAFSGAGESSTTNKVVAPNTPRATPLRTDGKAARADEAKRLDAAKARRAAKAAAKPDASGAAGKAPSGNAPAASKPVLSFKKKTPDAIQPIRSKGRGNPKADAKAAADLKADVNDYNNALGDAIDGKDVAVPAYRTKGEILGQAGAEKLTPDVAKNLSQISGDDIKDATEDAKKPAVQRLLAKTPVPVLVEALKSFKAKADKRTNRYKALTFAALVTLQHREESKYVTLDHAKEVAEKLFDASDVFEGTIETVHLAIELLHPVAEALAPAVHQLLGLSADEDPDAVALAFKPFTKKTGTDAAPSDKGKPAFLFAKKGDAKSSGKGDAPILTVADLRKAISAYASADDADKPRLKRTIMARARALGKPDLIPDSWTKVAASNPIDRLDIALTHAALARQEAEADVVALAGRLDFSPKHNYVEDNGGLPKYIEDIAIALIRDHGMDRQRAIPIAISRVRKWASGVGNVNADTRVKAAAAVAQYNALLARTHAKTAAKNAAKAVKSAT